MTNARVMQVATSLNSALANYHIGMIIAFAGSTAPNGWFICDGREVSRTEYSRLFALIGITYGNGDGTTTFNIPNLQDRFLQGASTTNVVGTSKEAGLPSHTHNFTPKGNVSVTIYANNENYQGGVFSYNTASAQNIGTTWSRKGTWSTSGGQISTSFNGTESETTNPTNTSIYGNTNTVQPPSVCINYIIKY